MPDMTTIAACSTALGAIMCIAMLLTWFKDGRPGPWRWQFAPFGIAVPAGILLTYPEILPGDLGLAFGWFGLTLVYGTVWLAARVTAGRTPHILPMLLPCVAVLIFSMTIASNDAMPQLRMLPRALLFALFDGLTAREFMRMRHPQLPSATMLFWVFAAFCGSELLRVPFSLSLAAPFGPAETQPWSVGLFNSLLVLEGLLFGIFITALSREQLAARHYRLALVDPLTGTGNRRALDERLKTLDSVLHTGMPTAVALFDIDHFKAVNDELGHSFGDTVIVGAAMVAREAFGDGNVFRVGGEEFAVIVQAPTPTAILGRADAARAAFAARRHVSGEKLRRCTLSVGVAMLEPGDDLEARFVAADDALYRAKQDGRNRTVMATAMTHRPLVMPEPEVSGAAIVPLIRRRLAGS